MHFGNSCFRKIIPHIPQYNKFYYLLLSLSLNTFLITLLRTIGASSPITSIFFSTTLQNSGISSSSANTTCRREYTFTFTSPLSILRSERSGTPDSNASCAWFSSLSERRDSTYSPTTLANKMRLLFFSMQSPPYGNSVLHKFILTAKSATTVLFMNLLNFP